MKEISRFILVLGSRIPMKVKYDAEADILIFILEHFYCENPLDETLFNG